MCKLLVPEEVIYIYQSSDIYIPEEVIYPYSQKIVVVCFDISSGSVKDQLKGLPLFHLPWRFLMAELASWVIC